MVLELHVLGPGFGLPSIDVECLAAIIYLQRSFADHDRNQGEASWQLVASNNFDISPFRRLPALRVQGSTSQGNGSNELWVAGFENIVEFLRQTTVEGAVDLDADLDKSQQADSYALTSFIQSRGGPLLDLSLYVSSENYNTRTRPALGELLYWPESWSIPHTLREDARRRSEHLGLSALDVDSAKEQEEKEANEGLASHIPKSLRKPKQTVSGLLGKSAQQTRFRLEVVTDDFLEPLQDRLSGPEQGRQSLLGKGFHSVDCLAVAYITLMQQPELPQSWLHDTLATRHSILGEWAKSHAADLLDSDSSTATSTGSRQLKSKSLPWTAPAARSLAQTSLSMIENLIRTIPGLRLGYESAQVKPSVTHKKRSHKAKQTVYADLRKKQVLYSQILTSTIATTSIFAWLLYAGIVPFSRSKPTPASRNFGEAGSLLGLR